MSTFQGILIRNNLSDTGTIPRTGAWTGCPDIIPYGQTPVNDPLATFGTDASYAKDLGVDITAGNVNYIYLRGKNLTATADTGKAYLFYAPSSVVLYPTTWMQNHIPQVALGDAPQPLDLPAAPNSVGVVTKPFVWVNPVLPASGEHYCLVAMLASAGETIQQIVAEANKVHDSASLALWILNNGGTGWRNVVTTNVGAAQISTATNYRIEGPEATISFRLVCTNMPAGSEVAFSAPEPTGTGEGYLPINLPRTKIPPPKGGKDGDIVADFEVGITTKVPQGYSSKIYYQWYSNGFTAGPDWSLTLTAICITNGNDALKNHPVSFAALVGEDSHHYHPVHGLVKGFNRLRAAPDPDNPFGPPDVPTLAAGVIGSHSTVAK